MKSPFNNNLPNQANDVMVNPVNPVNPDSKTRLLHASFSPKNDELINFGKCFLLILIQTPSCCEHNFQLGT
jgi:hypothetical protein